jgi:hypothetical protein
MNPGADLRERYRSLGHLGLIASFLAALAALLLRSSIIIHVIVGLVFVAFVIVHIAQRRRTTGKLATYCGAGRGCARSQIR